MFNRPNILKKVYKLLIVCNLFSFAFLPVIVSAASLYDLQEQQRDLNKQIEENRQKVKEKKKVINELSGQIDQLDSNISVTETKIAETENSIAKNQDEIKKTENEISERKRQLDNELENQSESVRAIYEAQKYSDPLHLIMGFKTLSQLLNYNNYMEALEEKIETSIDQITDIKKGLESKKEELEGQKRQLVALEEQNKAYKEGLEEQKDTKSYLLGSAQNEKQSLEQKIEEAKKMQSQINAQISAIIAARSRASSGTRHYNNPNATFMWPCDYQYISAFFLDPDYYAVMGIQHYGVDFANVSGTPIYAAADGYVEIVNYGNWGYGNYVAISHSDSLWSLYGHMSSMVVSVDQYVHKGDIIGYMGSTGMSTGPHLHFEVRLNNSPVDPFGYL